MGHAIPVAYVIRREGGLTLEIALVESEKLLIHEETIPNMLESLIERIREDGVLKAPVIVDRKTLVVLDGMHRVEALRKLGCRFICVCLVDYMNPEIRVDRWCRVILGGLDVQEAVNVATDLRIRLEPLGMNETSHDEGLSQLIFRGSCYRLLTPHSDPLTSFKTVRDFELRLKSMGFKVEYEAHQDAEERLEDGIADAVLCPPKIRKEQVVELARAGRVLVFKATRHIIPARPLGVDVPLSLLRDDGLSVEEANERLSSMLSRRKLVHLSKGASWNGRRYEEDLYAFEGD
jgi:hypothetical protein